MADVWYDYTKCDGKQDCAKVCPVDILEVLPDGSRWCKPRGNYVTNKEAVEAYHAKVEPSNVAVPIIIHNDMPECIECMACVAACTSGAIQVQSSYSGPAVESIG